MMTRMTMTWSKELVRAAELTQRHWRLRRQRRAGTADSLSVDLCEQTGLREELAAYRVQVPLRVQHGGDPESERAAF